MEGGYQPPALETLVPLENTLNTALRKNSSMEIGNFPAGESGAKRRVEFPREQMKYKGKTLVFVRFLKILNVECFPVLKSERYCIMIIDIWQHLTDISRKIIDILLTSVIIKEKKSIS